MAIAVRLVYVPDRTYLPRLLSRKLRERDPYPPWQAVALIGWTGMRGIVSLALALALPLTLPSGEPFPSARPRDRAVVRGDPGDAGAAGPHAAAVIRVLGLKDDGARPARGAGGAAARQRGGASSASTEIDSTSIINPQLLERVRLPYEQRLERLTEQTREDPECRLTEGEAAAFQPPARRGCWRPSARRWWSSATRGGSARRCCTGVQEALDLEALQPDR